MCSTINGSTRQKLYIYIYTVKPVKLTTFIRWPPNYVDHISVEPVKSCRVCIYEHLRNFFHLYMLDTCLGFPCEMEPGYCLYLPILTMVVLQASQMEQVLVMSSLMDQGIIQVMKANYRKSMLHSLLAAVGKFNTATEFAKSVTVFDAIRWCIIRSFRIYTSKHKREFRTKAEVGINM